MYHVILWKFFGKYEFIYDYRVSFKLILFHDSILLINLIFLFFLVSSFLNVSNDQRSSKINIRSVLAFSVPHPACSLGISNTEDPSTSSFFSSECWRTRFNEHHVSQINEDCSLFSVQV